MSENILPIYIQFETKRGMPSIVLRTSTTNNDLIKTIIQAAFQNQPLVLMPQFRNNIKAISTIIDKGIAHRDAEGNLVFNF